jgi:hypothetical protein
LQVDEGDLFTTGIARSLATDRDDVEVLNLGVSGYGTDDELHLLRQYGARLAPDRLLAFFFIGNDVHNNLLQSGMHARRRHVLVSAAGAIVHRRVLAQAHSQPARPALARLPAVASGNGTGAMALGCGTCGRAARGRAGSA